MEILKNVKIDWLGHRRMFFLFSAVLLSLSLGAYFFRGGFAFGIDFTGGTVAFIKFQQAPDVGKIRSALSTLPGTPLIQTFGKRGENKVQVKLEQFGDAEDSIGQQSAAIKGALHAEFNAGLSTEGKADINDGDLGVEEMAAQLEAMDPLGLRATRTLAEQATEYRELAVRIMDLRKQKGLIADWEELRAVPGMTDAALGRLRERFYAGAFTIQGVQSIGAVVGKDLRNRAQNAVGLSLIGMLVYIAFRFKHWSYGIGAVLAVFHDVMVTLGAFLLTNKEISLTVIASLLTIVGYSVNDTIVIFDRVRDNLKLMRRDNFKDIMNASINQTLARTVLTSGFTFLAVISIFLFGGEVLDGFAFALVVGIIAGTYSTVAIAGPIVLIWHNWFGKQQQARGA